MNKKALAFSTLALFLASAAAVYAQDFTPLTTIDGLFEANVPTNPVKVLSGIYGFAIGIGAVIAVIMIIWGGFEYMYQESIGSKSAAKERITNAFLGLGVILASFIILRTINADLVDFNLHLPGASGQLGGLIDSREQLDNAIAQLRDAKKQSDDLKAQIAEINKKIGEISNNPDIMDVEKAVLVSKLGLERAVLAARESELRNDAIIASNVARMENYVTEEKNALTVVINTDKAVQSGLQAYKDKRAALDAAYKATSDPKYAALIVQNDIDEFVFSQKSEQLKILANYKERSWLGQWLAADEEGLAEQMRKNGANTAAELLKAGKTAEAKTFQEETAVRIKMICKKCTS